MKTVALIIFLGMNALQAQVNKDLDLDGIKDFVEFNEDRTKIVCKLSTQNFKPIFSKEIEATSETGGLRATKSGFEFYVNHMRDGYAAQFRYERKEKAVRLIGVSRYSFGPASNDGSGESSVNLLTNQYIGEWNYFDEKKLKLIKIPSIKRKMIFKKMLLSNFDEAIVYEFMQKCSDLFSESKENLLNNSK